MSNLAINGGKKIRSNPFPAHQNIGKEELREVSKIIENGVLSQFLGVWHDDFFGGPEIQQFEQEWAKKFNVKHAISVNSCTSGLFAAIGAAGVEPGDEVIVSPYTMSASAVAPLVYNAIPVFADIEPDHFCLSPESIEQKITSRTKAIIVVDIFGQPYDADKINAIAKKHNLIVIEDTAQAPGAKLHNKYAGTLGDIGVFSLNYHKHIHSGEGGVVVTNNDELANRVRLIRNHAESVVEKKGDTHHLHNLIGFNYRMTEIQAAIARIQLSKLDQLLLQRQENVSYLENRLKKMDGITPAKTRQGAFHAFYVHPLLIESEKLGVSRDTFINAVKAELPFTLLREQFGPLLFSGYVRPLYLLPLFQQKIAFGKSGFPFTLATNPLNYEKGVCPIAESMHYHKLAFHEMMTPSMTENDLNDVANAFEKVWENRHELSEQK